MLIHLLESRLAERLRSDADIDRNVAEAMIAVKRHRFVRWRYFLQAYHDHSIPTGTGTSISQPSYIAKILSYAHIQSSDRVLEIGTGSGYTAAVLARLGARVVTVERQTDLVELAQRRLKRDSNVKVVLGDGCQVVDGTFNAILVMAGAPSIPRVYCERLRDGGRLIIPVGERLSNMVRGKVMRVTKQGSKLVEEELIPGDWNLLIGVDGWQATEA